MIKKIAAVLTAFTLAAACLASCSDKEEGADSQKADNSAAQTQSANDTQSADASEGETDESTADEPAEGDSDLKAPVNDGPIDLEQGATDNMITRSVYFEGDKTRLAEKVRAAIDLQNDDSKTPQEKVDTPMKIAFLGDSITAGSTTSSSQMTYTAQFEKWWEDNVCLFSKAVNAGIGATDSYLGVHRVEDQVLAEKPDIIFIEFINDSDTDFYKTTMDSLVRKCLAAENNPAVVLIEMTTQSGGCPQNVHGEIAEYYGVPVISYHDAIMPEIEAGNLTWETTQADEVHPNDTGHTLLANLLIDFVGDIKDNIDSYTESSQPFDSSMESPTGDKYADAKLADTTSDLVTVTDLGNFKEGTSTLWNFPNGWSTTDGGTYTCEMEFKNLGMLMLKGVGGNMGAATITVDGEEVKTLDGNFEGGWGDYAYNEEICSFDEKGKHTVSVTVDDGKYFEIISWMLS